MAIHAHPVPAYPYAPTPPLPSSTSSTSPNPEETIIHPSPFIPVRLPIFALVIALNEAVLRVVSVGTGVRAVSGGRSGVDTGLGELEGVEEGEGIPLRPLGGRGGSSTGTATRTRRRGKKFD